MKKRIFQALCYCVFASTFLNAQEELFKSQDVGRIMNQIFAQHVDKKEMTPEILKKSFKVYIDQFDPERIYLLDGEVRPFLDMEQQELKIVMMEYSLNRFNAFERLNGVIQNAIFRAREMREQIEKDRNQLFNAPLQGAEDYEEWSDPDLKLRFSKTIPELKKRMTNHLIRFINAEKNRFGAKKVLDYETQTLDIYNKHLNNFENQYLFINDAGQPMNPAAKENLFLYHVLKAMANSLDAHTTVLNPAEAYDMRVRLEKGFQGIGIGIKQMADGSLEVSRLIDGSPAAVSGEVKVGDQLYEVDGKVIDKMPLDKAMDLLRGTNGSTVHLLLKRQNPQTKAYETVRVELKRAEIAVNEDRVETTYEPFENGIIGKITLHSFYQGAHGVSSENDVRKAIEDLSKTGPIKGLILDLRENSGGFLSQAVKVAGLFITNGVIVISKYSNGEEHFYRDMNSKDYYSGPLIILTSKATASAAEIVAQALQDYGVALVVGDEHTYGKGTIQSQTVTDDKSTSYFKVTVGEYYTVSGKTPQIQGVKADIVVPSPFIDEHIGEEYLEYPLKPDTIPPSYNDPLTDVDPNMRNWYLNYYTPTLQRRVDKWRNMLPTLREDESKRLSANPLYKQFIATQHSNSVEADKIRKLYWTEDVQMQEAVKIIKDMVALEGNPAKNSATADGKAVGSPN